jgi:4-hydroxy-tetrahydrodipicolinate synthase
MAFDFKGTGTALVTPFSEDLTVDYDSFRRLLEYNIENGVEYLVVQGTTGESPTCTEKEKTEMLEFVLDYVDNRVPVVFGIGGNNTAKVVETIKNTSLKQVKGVLSASPYYNKPSQEGIYWHYMNLADKSEAPIIIYNVPGRTASNISARTIIRLSEHPNICGVKEASGDLVQCMQIAQSTPEDFHLISGDDLLTVPMIAIGATGVISVVSNGFPASFSKMVRDALAGHFDSAREKLKGFLSINPLLYAESNPVGIKQVLKIKGITENFVRPPLMPASEELAQKLGLEAHLIP